MDDRNDDGFYYWSREDILNNLARNGTVTCGGRRTLENMRQLVREELVEIVEDTGVRLVVRLTDVGRVYKALRGSP